MYVRLKSYEASTFSDHVMPYRCVHCQYETTARAYAYAKGVGLSPYGLDDHGAEARADRHARASAAAQAALSIKIAPCPRCHRRDRDPLFEVYRTTLAVCAAIVILPVALIAWSGQAMAVALVLGPALGALPALLLWRYKTSQLFSNQVRFDLAPEARPAITPARPAPPVQPVTPARSALPARPAQAARAPAQLAEPARIAQPAPAVRPSQPPRPQPSQPLRTSQPSQQLRTYHQSSQPIPKPQPSQPIRTTRPTRG